METTENKTIKSKVTKKNGKVQEITWEGGTLEENTRLGYEICDSYSTENLNEAEGTSVQETVYILKQKNPGLILG